MKVAMLDSVASLVQELQRHQLLAGPQLEELAVLSHGYGDARALARELLQRNWLSAFQVNHLLAGRGGLLVFGSYLLLDRLGEGATGQVFKARHLHMRRLVALKVLRPELLTDPEVLQRFHREVRVISQLADPHIVHAFDAGQIGTTHYLALEY